MLFPECERNPTILGSTTKDSPGKRGGPHKCVTMAPTSRYLTDRQYLMRRPLFSEEQHTSILKKTCPLRHTLEDEELGVSRKEENQPRTAVNALAGARAGRTSESFSPSDSDLSPPSIPALSNNMTSLELHFQRRTSAQQSLPSSFLKAQRLTPPLRPPLNSTVLHPTNIPCSGSSGSGQSLLCQGRRKWKAGREIKLSSSAQHSAEHSQGSPMSTYQANYWACAIPNDLPPAPDRHSTGWDPNRDYQALLDYTYPLRPGHITEHHSSNLQDVSLLQTDPNLQDSGIEMDHSCNSISLSISDLAVRHTGPTTNRDTLSVAQKIPELQAWTKSSTRQPSSPMVSLTNLSLDSPQPRHSVSQHQLHALSTCSSTAFLHSSRGIPLSKSVCADLNEEFLPLPEQLKEMQSLSRQVREITAKLRQPFTASWESEGRGVTSANPSVTLTEEHGAGDKEREAASLSTNETTYESTTEKRSAADHWRSEAARTSGSWAEPVGGAPNRSCLQEEALVQQLCGLALTGIQKQEPSESLMQHIQVFCSHLEQLIQQLHAVSERTELLATPAVDVEGMKLSLAEFQSFQSDLGGHQPLTSSVLHTGQLLLSCINTMSPFLRDTLGLVEKQSGLVETHTGHFFSSVLSAMGSFSNPKPAQQNKAEQRDPGLVGIQGSTL
ncbi:uncharacterized protein V6R79_013897 [Siganus canaliculatus]